MTVDPIRTTLPPLDGAISLIPVSTLDKERDARVAMTFLEQNWDAYVSIMNLGKASLYMITDDGKTVLSPEAQATYIEICGDKPWLEQLVRHTQS